MDIVKNANVALAIQRFERGYTLGVSTEGDG